MTRVGHILPEEAERFGKLARDWWDPAGSSVMLHKLNPVRLKYVRDQVDRHWQSDECSRTPLDGKRALDVGCGAGLLAEPLARLGAKVTGADTERTVEHLVERRLRECGAEAGATDGRGDDLRCKRDAARVHRPGPGHPEVDRLLPVPQ